MPFFKILATPVRPILVDQSNLSDHMARTSPGNDWFKYSRGSLCQRVEPLFLASHASGLKSCTVSHVLKYSLNCVIKPSFRVHTCTQYSCAPSHPSAKTQLPTAVILRGVKRNSANSDLPVRNHIMCWQWGGPWNHHSRSLARRHEMVSVPPHPKAS